MENLLPALALLVCPVGMGLMMLFMGKGMLRKRSGPPEPSSSPDDLRRQHAELSDRIEQLEQRELVTRS